MKRKLIDIDDETFELLRNKATSEGTNLKQYIEKKLEDDATCLKDSGAVLSGYRLTMEREPSDRELSFIMESAAKSARERHMATLSKLFGNLEMSIKNIGRDGK